MTELHPDIPEEGPKIGGPGERNAAGFFCGGPQLAINGGWLALMDKARLALAAEIEKAAPTQAERREKRKAKRSALSKRREAELAILRDQIRAARQAVAA